MSVVSREDFIARLSEKLGNSDEDLSLLEDFEDSFPAEGGENSISLEEHEKKVAEVESAWREKYKARFSGKKQEETKKEEELEVKKETFDSLFEEKKEG